MVEQQKVCTKCISSEDWSEFQNGMNVEGGKGTKKISVLQNLHQDITVKTQYDNGGA